MEIQASTTGFGGLRVLSLESRRAPEMGKLIVSYGGNAVVAPSMREVPLESNAEAQEFARQLVANAYAMVIFLTGVGTRSLVRVAQTVVSHEEFVAALGRVTVVARGPKPVAALREIGVAVAVAVPEPNTWREVLGALDERRDSLPLKDRRVAVQEYGASNPELLAGLAERGARVEGVPVYEWALPEDVGPLRKAIEAIANGEIDLALFTTSVQVVHLLRIAEELQLTDAVRKAFGKIVIGSIGPVTSETLREQGIAVDFEPSHPKMGFLVNEIAKKSSTLVSEKRRKSD